MAHPQLPNHFGRVGTVELSRSAEVTPPRYDVQEPYGPAATIGGEAGGIRSTRWHAAT